MDKGRFSRFVTPSTEKYPLRDGDDWILIKTELTAGDREKLSGMLLSGVELPRTATNGAADAVNADMNIRMNWAEAKLGKVEAYLVDWSFQQGDKSVEVTSDSIYNLTGEDLDEIADIIDTHIEQQEKVKKASRRKRPAKMQS